ncbi:MULTISPECIES: hypothetical protein [Mesorhizobium]|uniref:hypothetical protein n=1 Tax=Mesorhizobium TaxID=68287 RepID=UPI0010A97742|nr:MULTISPECIES: hypothetical protein [Mesorhizobium]
MTHADVINLWPSLTEFAADIAVEYGTAKAMRRRESIPVEYWPALIRKAEERQIAGINPASLLDAAVPLAVEDRESAA